MKILAVCNNHNSLSLLDLSKRMADTRQDLEVVAVCEARLSAEVERNLKDFAKSKIYVWSLDGSSGVGDAMTEASSSKVGALGQLKKWAVAALAGRGRKLGAWIKASTPGQMLAERYIAMRLERAKQISLGIIYREKPTAVFSISDRTHDYLESSLLWAARQRKVKVVLPYVAHYDKDYAVGYRKNEQGRIQKEFNPFSPINLYKIWSFFRFKSQLYMGAFFQAPYLLSAHRKSDTLSSYPWWAGNGLSDIVCVNSRHAREIFLVNRVPEEKLKLMGDVNYDMIVERNKKRKALKSEYINRYGLDPERKTIVLAAPQFVEQGLLGEKAHWESINTLMAELVGSGCNVLVSLHPRMDPREYAFIEEKFKCRIAKERLAEFLVVADVFVAQVSSTVVWAVLCGIPTVVLDHLSLNKNFYDYLKTVRVVREISLVGKAVFEACTADALDFENDWNELSKTEVFDGKTIDRYVKLLEETD